jgi:hypothetical protein
LNYAKKRFLYIGKEAIGSAVLSGIWGAVFGYLAGFGTSNFFKDEKIR